jgi:hypothetical protein
MILFGLFFLGLCDFEKFPKVKLKWEPKMWFLALFYLLPIVSFWSISQIEPIFVSRYFVPYNFAWYIIISYNLYRNSYKKVNRFFLTVLISALLIDSVMLISNPYQESNWKEKTSLMKENWQQYDVALILPPSDIIRCKFYAGKDSKIYLDKDLYKKIFSSRPNPVSQRDLEQAFVVNKPTYKRLWYHKETQTGLSAEFNLCKEETIYNFLTDHFTKVDDMEYHDARGRLSLFLLK